MLLFVRLTELNNKTQQARYVKTSQNMPAYVCVEEFNDFLVLEQFVDWTRDGVMLADAHEKFTHSLPERCKSRCIRLTRLELISTKASL